MKSSRSFRLGSRGSRLALAQASLVLEELRRRHVHCEITPIKSKGDLELSEALYAISGSTPGLFTTELEEALLDHRIDLAVHSLKDLPTTQPDGLTLIAITRRESAADVLIANGKAFAGSHDAIALRPGATVGTSSLRREAQLTECRPDLRVISIRGNITTRIEKVARGDVDAVVLAEAGISRIGPELGDLRVAPLKFVAAPGQGALAIQVRRDCDEELRVGLKCLDDRNTRLEVDIERRVLKGLMGGCTLPLGVRVVHEGAAFRLTAFLGALSTRAMPEEPHRWLGFEHFDISGEDGDTLVLKTIDHLKGFLNRCASS